MNHKYNIISTIGLRYEKLKKNGCVQQKKLISQLNDSLILLVITLRFNEELKARTNHIKESLSIQFSL